MLPSAIILTFMSCCRKMDRQHVPPQPQKFLALRNILFSHDLGSEGSNLPLPVFMTGETASFRFMQEMQAPLLGWLPLVSFWRSLILSVASYLNTPWLSAGVPLCKSLPVEHWWTFTTKFDQTWSLDSACMSWWWLTMWCLCGCDLLTVHWWKQYPPCRVGIVHEGPMQRYRARYSKLNMSRKNTVTVCSISLEQGFSQHNCHFRANNYLSLEAILYRAWSLSIPGLT